MSRLRLPGRLWLVVVIVGALILAASVWFGSAPRDYLTVAEVAERPGVWNGQQVRVRGWASATTTVTVQGCVPPRCDCNQSRTLMYLTDRDPLEIERWDKVASVRIDGYLCEGDECTLTCPLFNPNSAQAFEFVGVLSVGIGGEPTLQHIDLSASRRLTGVGPLENWSAFPIDQRPHTIILRTPDP